MADSPGEACSIRMYPEQHHDATVLFDEHNHAFVGQLPEAHWC